MIYREGDPYYLSTSPYPTFPLLFLKYELNCILLSSFLFDKQLT